MASLKSWINAARVRTLPLAISGILTGCAMAYQNNGLNITVAVLAIITALFIQIFSNFANDFGDFKKGTDNEQRIGPARTMQSGLITVSQMKTAMIIVVALSLISGIWLVAEGTKNLELINFGVFILFGVLALIAAFKYTAGKNPYGYAGFGDLAVFIFFGILPVAGTYFLSTNTFEFIILIPSVGIGMFCTGVLNLNNMRDIENDKNSGKKTIAVKIGIIKAGIYHLAIITTGLLAFISYMAITGNSIYNWIFIAAIPTYIFDLYRITKITNPSAFDPFLKKLSLSTLILTVLFCAGIFLSQNL